jgi:SAM-dependent methyltransferase
MHLPVRFSSLVRKGLAFRKKFEALKASHPAGFTWYPYDSFANLFLLQRLLDAAGLTFEQVAGSGRLLDIGAADGALTFFFESLGWRVQSWDHSGTNINRMQAIHALASALTSQADIRDIDLDRTVDVDGRFDCAIFLGILYHLKNPYNALELLSTHCRYCFVSTRVAKLSAPTGTSIESIPAAVLVAPDECNGDATNYWIFSPAGLRRIADRTGWNVLAEISNGAPASDPYSPSGDERIFLLLESRCFS